MLVTIDPNSGSPEIGLELVGDPKIILGVAVPAGRLRLVGRGGVPPFAYAIVVGTSLPTGLTLNPTTGDVTGTPTVQGKVAFIASLTDTAATVFPHSFAIDVIAGLFPLQVTPTPCTRGLAYRYQVLFADASGSTAGITYALQSGSFPTGLSISSAGVISGTNTTGAFGAYYVVIRGTKGSATLDFQMVVSLREAFSGTATIAVGPSLRNMTVGVPVDDVLTITAAVQVGKPPYTWELTSGALPSGLLLDPRGRIYGTPDALTPSTYAQPTFTITDGQGQTRTYTPSGADELHVGSPLRSAAKGRFFVSGADGDPPIDIDYNAIFFGFGTDGDIVLDGTAVVAGFSKSGSTYTLTKEQLYADNLTINSTAKLRGNGRVIYVADTLDISAAVAAALNVDILTPASGNTAGTPPPGYNLGGGGQGSNGGIGIPGNNPASPATPATLPYALGGKLGTPGGLGGNAVSGTGVGQSTDTPLPLPGVPHAVFFRRGGDPISGGCAGGAGGAGAGNGITNGGNGGGSGPGAGSLVIFARRLRVSGSTPVGCISATGGDGGNGVAGGGTNRSGGGGAVGGGGGFVFLCVGEIDGAGTATDAIEADGGNGGTGGASGGGTGVAGANGAGNTGGTIVLIDLSGPTMTVVTSTTAPSGQTAGTTRLSL